MESITIAAPGEELAAEGIDCSNACIHNCLILGDNERHEHFERETGRERNSQYMETRSDDSISPDLKNFFCLE